MDPRIRRLLPAIAGAIVASTLTIAGGSPPAAAEPGPSLVFATWNVCKTQCPSPAPSWAVRRSRVALTINESGADIIAVTEATQWPFRSRTQWQDIQLITRPGGYASPVIQTDVCKRLGCTYGPRLLIRSDTVEQLSFGRLASAGTTRLDRIAPGLRFDADRQVTWAFLQGKGGTGPFLAMSVHLTNDKSAAGEQHRVEFGRAATPWAQALAARRGLAGVPIILMGDLNSIDVRQPEGVQQVLRSAGWVDAIDAPERLNVDINSINYSPLHPSGWSTMPIRHPRRLASRIDYILSLGPVQPLRYEVVAHLNPDGSYDQRYQGSDHLMVTARLAFTG